MTVNVCVPVIKRYDRLQNLLVSLKRSTIAPKVWVIDNGRLNVLPIGIQQLMLPYPVDLYVPDTPMGVAASWNWFIDHVPEERLISNDDIEFAPESLAIFTASKADIVWAEGCGFSCFLLRDSCVEKIGKFDEEISPGYAYYEDDDYLQRIDGHGTRAPSASAENVKSKVVHFRSSTLQACTPAEIEEHHRKFQIAQGNYAKKWGLELAFERERMLRESAALK